jgi:GNAT superfamily N-acetyltransferase
VARDSWWATYRDIMPSEEIRRRLAEWYSRGAIEDSVRDDGAIFLVAEHRTSIVGYAHLGWTPAGPELFRLYARPELWRRGVGTSLLGALESELSAMGESEYRCRVHRDNHVGRAFYAQAGFDRDEGCDTDEEMGLVRRFGSPSLP